MKFSQIQYKRPNTAEMIGQLKCAVTDFESAQSVNEQFLIYDKVDDIFENFLTQFSIIRIKYNLNSNDEFYSEEQVYLMKEYAKMIEQFNLLSKKLIKSPYLDELRTKIGDVTVKNIELMFKTSSKETQSLSLKERGLVQKYTKLISSLQVEFNGEKMPLTKLAPYKESTDREIRKSAYETEGNCYNSIKPKLDEIFSELVKVRCEQAQILGYKSFVELGYARVKRNCYTQNDVAVFRKEVVQNVVPIVTKIRKARLKRLSINTDKMNYCDMSLSFKDGSPKPVQDPREILNAAKIMYSEMAEQTNEAINLILDNELYDVEPRVGKMPTGFCSHMANYNYPFVVANFNGTSTDVYVLTHEIGHAVAKYLLYKSGRKQFTTISSDISETHSMAMEFLATPWYELFFKEQAQKYALAHAEDALIFLPYACQVDEFQEFIYNNPNITPKQRDEKWLELEKTYRPDISAQSVPFYEDGAGWQRQAHIYKSPFYYIDYALAQVLALQIFGMYLNDKDKALKLYFDFIDNSDRKTFVELISYLNLLSPFSKGSLKQIAENICEYIENIM